MSADSSPPFVIVVSGPSGVGKDAVCERLLAADPTLAPSVSTTTRKPRPGETPGVDYHFVSEEEFSQGVMAGAFLEWAVVHQYRYGTSRAAIEDFLRRGLCPLLNIDVQGGKSIKQALPDALLIFLMPPDEPTLEARLRGRGTDDEERLRVRLANASWEMDQRHDYDYVVVNDDLDQAVAEVQRRIAARREGSG